MKKYFKDSAAHYTVYEKGQKIPMHGQDYWQENEPRKQATPFNHKFKSWIYYLFDYLHYVFFKVIILFIVSFFGFGLYFADYFKENLILAIIFLVIILWLIKQLLYKRAKLTKILVVLVVLLISFYASQAFSAKIFDKVGITSFFNNALLGSNLPDQNKGNLNDRLILASTANMLKTITDKTENITAEVSKSSKEQSQDVLIYINQLRQENGVSTIEWNDKIYELAKYKVEDITKRDYFDHPDPEGHCAGYYASNFGLTYPTNSFADNLFGYSAPTLFDQKEAVDSWMTSRGHKYNLLYPGHIRGAFACDSQNCIFIGQGGSGWVCDTGANGLAYWETAPNQPGE